jgi:hypothetical protein
VHGASIGGGGGGTQKKSKRQQKLERRAQQVEAQKARKHELCSRIATAGACQYGDDCRFSHGGGGRSFPGRYLFYAAFLTAVHLCCAFPL